MNRFKITQRFLMVAAFTALLCTNAAAFTVNVPSHGMTEAPSIHAWTNSGDLTSWPGQTPVNYFGGCWQYSFTPNVSPVYIIINDKIGMTDSRCKPRLKGLSFSIGGAPFEKKEKSVNGRPKGINTANI